MYFIKVSLKNAKNVKNLPKIWRVLTHHVAVQHDSIVYDLRSLLLFFYLLYYWLRSDTILPHLPTMKCSEVLWLRFEVWNSQENISPELTKFDLLLMIFKFITCDVHKYRLFFVKRTMRQLTRSGPAIQVYSMSDICVLEIFILVL